MKHFSIQFKRYSQTVNWLYRKVISLYPGKIILAQATNFLGPFLMSGALGLLIYFVHKMETNSLISVKYLPISLEPRNSAHFAVFVIFIGFVLLTSAVFTYLSNKINIQLSVQFAIDLSKSVLTLRGARPSQNADPTDAPYHKDVLRCSKSIIGMARAIRPLMQIFEPLFHLIICLVALIYLNFSLTTIIAIIILPSLYFQYWINYSSAKNEEQQAKSQRTMQREILNLLDKFTFAPKMYHSASCSVETAYSQTEILEYPERYIFRVMARPKSQFVSSILIAILALVIITHLGSQALHGEISWAMILGYLVFARTGMIALLKLLGTITGFSRHYPISRKAFELLSSWPGEKRFDEDSIRIRRSSPDSPGDLRSMELKRGDVLAFLSPVPISRYNSYAVSDVLALHRKMDHQSLWGAMYCIPSAVNSCPGASLREILHLSSDLKTHQVLHHANHFGDNVDLSHIEVDALMEKEIWQNFPVFFRCHLLLESAVRSDKDIIFVENKILKQAQKNYLMDWWDKVCGRFIVVRHHSYRNIDQCHETLVMTMRPDRETALMTAGWADKNADVINSWIKKSKSTEIESNDDDFDDDDD